MATATDEKQAAKAEAPDCRKCIHGFGGDRTLNTKNSEYFRLFTDGFKKTPCGENLKLNTVEIKMCEGKRYIPA